MFELKILAANVLFPLAVMLAAWWSIRTRKVKPPNQVGLSDKGLSDKGMGSRWPAGVALVAGTLAIVGAFLIRAEVSRSLMPEDVWARLGHATALVSIGAAVALWIPSRMAAWLVRSSVVFFAARWMIPRGEAWEFLDATAPVWLAFLTGGTLLAWWLIDRLDGKWPAILGLSWIACIVAAAFLTKDFLRVTEPLLAVATVLGVTSLMGLFNTGRQVVSTLAGPLVFAMSAAVANAQFNSFLGLPDSLSWLAISAPALAALPSIRIPRQGQGEASPRSTIVWLVVGSLLLAALVIGWTAVTGGAGGEEDWS